MLNKSGLGLQNTMTSIENKYNSLISEIYELIGAVTGKWEFSTTYHIWAVKGERQEGGKYLDIANDVKLQEIVSDQGDFNKRLFLRAKHTGAWLSIQVTMVSITVLGAT